MIVIDIGQESSEFSDDLEILLEQFIENEYFAAKRFV